MTPEEVAAMRLDPRWWAPTTEGPRHAQGPDAEYLPGGVQLLTLATFAYPGREPEGAGRVVITDTRWEAGWMHCAWCARPVTLVRQWAVEPPWLTHGVVTRKAGPGFVIAMRMLPCGHLVDSFAWRKPEAR